MRQGTLLINGASLPHHVIDTAIGWAKQHGARLLGIFVFSDQRHAETYAFPSDIEQVETRISEDQGEGHLARKVAGNSDYLKKLALQKGVTVETILLKEPGNSMLASHLERGEILFLDPQTFTDPDEYANSRFLVDDIAAIFPQIIRVERAQ